MTGLESLQRSRLLFAPQDHAVELGADGRTQVLVLRLELPFAPLSAPQRNNRKTQKIVGNWREQTDSTTFVDRLKIRSVMRDGTIRGRLSIAAIIRNAKLVGQVDFDGNIEFVFSGQSEWAGPITGLFSGKLSRVGRRLRGTLGWTYGDGANGGSAAQEITFCRKITQGFSPGSAAARRAARRRRLRW